MKQCKMWVIVLNVAKMNLVTGKYKFRSSVLKKKKKKMIMSVRIQIFLTENHELL